MKPFKMTAYWATQLFVYKPVQTKFLHQPAGEENTNSTGIQPVRAIRSTDLVETLTRTSTKHPLTQVSELSFPESSSVYNWRQSKLNAVLVSMFKIDNC